MIWDIKKPCASCPYRMDAPRKLWAQVEFVKLLALDVDHDRPADKLGTVYGCHEYNKRPYEVQRPCAGWLLDQRRRDVPSIALRIALARETGAGKCLREVTSEVKMFRNIKAMCRANGVK